MDASISAAREDIYARPGAKPETRFSTIMEDLRRRDFSINAIAISLNPNSRGLLLDPTNGLADLERREIRALSIHSFTNQPVRLLRALRYEARMGFKMESRTREWFNLALERELQNDHLAGGRRQRIPASGARRKTGRRSEVLGITRPAGSRSSAAGKSAIPITKPSTGSFVSARIWFLPGCARACSLPSPWRFSAG